MRRAAKKDTSHNAIAAYLRKLGWSVADTHRQSDGHPDMVAGKPGWCCLIEVKEPGKKLTPKEQKFAEMWTGPLIVAYSPEHAAEQLLFLSRGWCP